MNDEKLSDSDMEDIAGGAGKKGVDKKKGDAGKPDPSKPGAGSGPFKGDVGGKGAKGVGIGKG